MLWVSGDCFKPLSLQKFVEKSKETKTILLMCPSVIGSVTAIRHLSSPKFHPKILTCLLSEKLFYK